MKHPPCKHEEGFCAVSQEIRVSDYTWALTGPTYITLIASSQPDLGTFSKIPHDIDITVLIEAANAPRRSYRDLYRPYAFVLRYWCDGPHNDLVAINSECIDFQVQEQYTKEPAFIELAVSAARLMRVGQGYFSDPDAS